jgi:tetratricopeptide (TPR) repeat protein|uniref:Tetratricopeptide repeat protein n=1 Tax=Desulfobacca acetoxidans TaxID=60893 RepID=A0A7C3Z9Z2_9BACT
MRQVRSSTTLVLAVGLCLLLAAGAAAQVTGYGSTPLPADIYGPLNEGFGLIADGKYDAAAVKFKDVLQKDPNNPFALNNLAAIEAQKGHYREAMAFLQQATVKANDYRQKVAQTCFVAGLCNAVKPRQEVGPTSTIAPIIQDNIAKLKPKVEALPPSPSSPPAMK